MNLADEIIKALLAGLAILIAAGIAALFIMWRDNAVMKRDIDALADIIGTDRAKARRPKADKKT